jgi:hypothetical protein
MPNAQVRQWIYGVVTAVLAVLVVYKIVDADAVPLWLTLAAAILGVGATGTATVAVSKQRKNGSLR